MDLANQTTANGGREAKTGTTTVGLVADGYRAYHEDERRGLLNDP